MLGVDFSRVEGGAPIWATNIFLYVINIEA